MFISMARSGEEAVNKFLIKLLNEIYSILPTYSPGRQTIKVRELIVKNHKITRILTVFDPLLLLLFLKYYTYSRRRDKDLYNKTSFAYLNSFFSKQPVYGICMAYRLCR